MDDYSTLVAELRAFPVAGDWDPCHRAANAIEELAHRLQASFKIQADLVDLHEDLCRRELALVVERDAALAKLAAMEQVAADYMERNINLLAKLAAVEAVLAKRDPGGDVVRDDIRAALRRDL